MQLVTVNINTSLLMHISNLFGPLNTGMLRKSLNIAYFLTKLMLHCWFLLLFMAMCLVFYNYQIKSIIRLLSLPKWLS